MTTPWNDPNNPDYTPLPPKPAPPPPADPGYVYVPDLTAGEQYDAPLQDGFTQADIEARYRHQQGMVDAQGKPISPWATDPEIYANQALERKMMLERLMNPERTDYRALMKNAYAGPTSQANMKLQALAGGPGGGAPITVNSTGEMQRQGAEAAMSAYEQVRAQQSQGSRGLADLSRSQQEHKNMQLQAAYESQMAAMGQKKREQDSWMSTSKGLANLAGKVGGGFASAFGGGNGGGGGGNAYDYRTGSAADAADAAAAGKKRWGY